MLGAGARTPRTARRVLALTRQNLPPLRTEAADEPLRQGRLSPQGRRQPRARSCWSPPARKSRSRSTPPSALEGAGHRRRCRLHAVLASCSTRRTPPIAPTSCRRATCCAVSIEAGDDAGLGALYRPRRPAHRHRPLRRLGPGRGPVSSTSASPPTQIVPQMYSATLNTEEAFTWRPRLRSTVSDASAALVARAILERPDSDLELVSINDLADAKSNACCSSATASTAPSRARSTTTATT